MKVTDIVGDKFGSFCPDNNKLGNLGLVAANSIAYCVNKQVPVRLVNVSDKGIKLRKNFVVGTFNIENENEYLGNVNVISRTKVDNDFNALLNNVQSNTFLGDKYSREAIHLLRSYKDVFSQQKFDIGYSKIVKHEINIKENSPVQQIVGKVPLNLEDWVDEQVKNLKDRGVIRESNSPWCAPIVVVKKKSGDMRMCIDYRRLNSITIKPIYKIPETETLLSHLHGAKIFSTIDVSNAYYQCGIKESHKQFTAFSTRKGHFEFNRMPFGLCGAPFTFQRLINTILRNENWLTCLTYLDDILIFSENFKEHIERLRQILGKIREAGIKLSPSKCKLFCSQVSFLGHVVSKDGIHTDPEKIKVLKTWPEPRSVSEMRRFLGFANYYRRFIKNFSELANPLHELIKDSSIKMHKRNDTTSLQWTQKSLESFNKLKLLLCESPVLSHPKIGGEYILDTDASFNTIGAVLSQVQNGVERVIAYGSRKLSKCEVKYCITRKELLSVYFFVTHFKQYLLGSKFVVRTDHKALEWLLNWDAPNTSQYCSWIAELEIYDFSIRHREGIKHTNADFLSRPFEPCGQCDLMHFNPQPKRNVKILKISDNPKIKTIKEEEIRAIHQNLGHIGRDKLKSVIEKCGYNASWSKISDVIQNCMQCCERKGPGKLERMHLHYTASRPFEKIAMDVAGPLPLTRSGKRYILSIIDVFSRNISLIPLANIETSTVIFAFQKYWLSHYGLPDCVITDGGTNFTSDEFEKYFKRLSVTHHVTSPYHPQSNGLIERYFLTAKDMIYCTSKQSSREWDNILWKIELGLRSSNNKSIALSPFEVLYGFTPKIDKNQEVCFNMSSINKDRIQIKNELVKLNNSKHAEHKSKYDLGEMVMFKNVVKKPNLYTSRFFGPGKIHKLLSDKCYQILFEGKLINRHEDHLKIFRGNVSQLKCKSVSNTNISSITPVQISRRYPSRKRFAPVRLGYNL